MALSPMQTTTLQAAGLAALSNVIAQLSQSTSGFDFVALFQFVLWALVSTPVGLSALPVLCIKLRRLQFWRSQPNYAWQIWLEDRFPAKSLSKREEEKAPSRAVQDVKKTNLRNLLIKFGLDQTVGSWINTYAFVAAFAYLRGEDVLEACSTKFWPMRIAALKVWPLVSLLNFTVVPVQYRLLLVNIVGVAWGIYLSLSVGK